MPVWIWIGEVIPGKSTLVITDPDPDRLKAPLGLIKINSKLYFFYDMSELERETNQLVYQLYDLTPDETAIVEASVQR